MATSRLRKRWAAARDEPDAYLFEQLTSTLYDRLLKQGDRPAAADLLQESVGHLARLGRCAEAAELGIRWIRHRREVDRAPFRAAEVYAVLHAPMEARTEAATSLATCYEAVLPWCLDGAGVDGSDRSAASPLWKPITTLFTVGATATTSAASYVRQVLVDAYVASGDWPRAQYHLLRCGGPAELSLRFIDQYLAPQLADEGERGLARARLALFYYALGDLAAARAYVELLERQHPAAPTTHLASAVSRALQLLGSKAGGDRRAVRALLDELQRAYAPLLTADPELRALMDEAWRVHLIAVARGR
ncbi:hypothetical protein CDCA_CDCA09G2779 [Cyanidium caldarium]|uniref:ER membrane protein complex subunit 2 n=1 Tax=Cyanidium caldarium TaxID=2771 RepID=A0AAV9IWU4_CYACA|nr:hypothetical protein CDCA_CDCA09G2779 [Cyanidium caldarium]